MTRKQGLNWKIGLSVAVIASLGVTVLFSIAPSFAYSQLGFFLLGIAAFLVFSAIDPAIHWALAPFYYVLSLLFLLLTLIFGEVTRGTVRWLTIGSFSLQPSELVKPFLIVSFAYFSLRYPPENLKNLAKLTAVMLLPVFLVFKQPSLGNSLVVLAIWFGVVFAAGLAARFLVLGSLGMVAGLPLVWRLLRPYQRERILSFLNPYQDPLGRGYHMIQALISVGSGKILGRGLGHGTQSQLRFLPERQSDFIFASLAEELGLVGSLILLVAFFFLLKEILAVAEKQKERFNALVATGVFVFFFFQTVVNLGINLNLLPVTGLTLPLVSSGGSSLLASFICLGLVQARDKEEGKKSLLEIK